ncbi:MAG: hypothetical protein ACJA1L_001217 [Paracoccaceae bacterium]|jgi:hypothetical protein
MRRRAFLVGAVGAGALAGCQATSTQQVAALSPSSSATDLRARQSRRFDTSDRKLMLQSSLGALQDLGFTIDESNLETGVIVGSKSKGAQLRAQVTVRATPGGAVVRATFQRYFERPGAMLSVGETLNDPELYQGFFERVAQSAFLTAHEI